MIEIHLNGEVRQVDCKVDLAGLIGTLSLSDKRVAVELNGSVIRRADWSRTPIKSDDRIEIVHFVGGG